MRWTGGPKKTVGDHLYIYNQSIMRIQGPWFACQKVRSSELMMMVNCNIMMVNNAPKLGAQKGRLKRKQPTAAEAASYLSSANISVLLCNLFMSCRL